MAEVLVLRDGPVGSIVISNPAKHNALSYPMLRAIPESIAQLERQPELRVIALKGGGTRSFVSGADVSDFGGSRGSIGGEATYAQALDDACRALLEAGRPTLACIRGSCMGAGVALALACDLRLCGDDAQFAIPAARLGLAYTAAAVRRLVDVLGPGFAAEVLLTARRFSAAEAWAMRLVNRVVDGAALEGACAALCAEIAANAPLTLAAARRAINETLKDAHERDAATVQSMIAACYASDDYREGREAFAHKRKPVFRGR